MTCMTTTEIIAVGTATISAIGCVATVIYSFKNSASTTKNDIIATYEKRMKLMEEDIEAMKKKLTEVGDMLQKSEEDRKKAEAILQGRNPELDRYMALTLKLLTEIHGAVLPQTVTPKT